ncbi:hypothetical protein DFP90_11644 [Aestuariispira insulae]|uniref:Uncharacterized protein n=1 Tax=Aestuariispira insulae TaxID=1461337 RepID=A0A3D9H3Y1_9PROT|nr:hypothetical protein DFP90_11644 [Aestuariispira insulae]
MEISRLKVYIHRELTETIYFQPLLARLPGTGYN